MAKRMHDTEIWDQDWFIDLPNKYKLLFNFIKDKCDDCGVWRPNKSLIQKIIGEPVSLEDFLIFVNTDEKERISVLPNKRWFLKEFFIFQYGNKFNPQSPVHRGFLKRLLSNSIHLNQIPKLICYNLQNADIEQLSQIAYQYPNDTLMVAYGYPINRAIDKDKAKAKDKEYIDIIEPDILKKTEPIGSDLVQSCANKAWGDQKWKENTCMANSLKLPQLQKWMAMYNASISNDNFDKFDDSTYKKLFGGWLQRQISKGYNVNDIKETKVETLKKM